MILKRTVQLLCLSAVGLVMFLGACESLKSARPIQRVKEYERMLLGDLNANYVGTANCLSACHYHDETRKFLDASTMGARLSPKSGMPLVDCESCHGPGSLAIAEITPEKVEEDRRQGRQTACNHKALIDIHNLPAGAKSLICLKCHSSHALFNLHNWNAGEHAQNDVSCSDCHLVHTGADLTTRPREVLDMCSKCHQEIRGAFFLPSHHPLRGRVFCNDCHEPHGSITEHQLRKNTIKETCIQCHREKGGPFLYEHADNMENCMTCHRPHGSVHNDLLQVSEPFLCLQCHAGHRITAFGGGPSSRESKGAFFTRCTDCHSEIHGTDHPSASGIGRFTQ
jgi:DmsE family decaheme c-type cytochrome